MLARCSQPGKAGQEFSSGKTCRRMSVFERNQGCQWLTSFGNNYSSMPAGLTDPLARVEMKLANRDGSHVHKVHTEAPTVNRISTLSVSSPMAK